VSFFCSRPSNSWSSPIQTHKAIEFIAFMCLLLSIHRPQHCLHGKLATPPLSKQLFSIEPCFVSSQTMRYTCLNNRRQQTASASLNVCSRQRICSAIVDVQVGFSSITKTNNRGTT
jgi:hypothetical protein